MENKPHASSFDRGPEYLLTIAIPTFNRAGYLDVCLEHIKKQLADHRGIVELIVSNNKSEDDTDAIVNKYIHAGLNIRYITNKENIGADRNIAQCYSIASGKYVLIFGDDDILLDDAIDRILDTLRDNEYGVVHLNAYGFRDDYNKEMPEIKSTGTVVYNAHDEFIRRINYWITFLSGNVINKSLIANRIDPTEFSGTNLVQLGWVLAAIFQAKENAVIEQHLVAFKTANTGGYRLSQVFGVNLNRIFEAFVQRGVPRSHFDIINRKLVASFFPGLFLISRRNEAEGFSFESEDHYKALHGVFRKYPGFWLLTVPALKLPLPLAKKWSVLATKIMDIAVKCSKAKRFLPW